MKVLMASKNPAKIKGVTEAFKAFPEEFENIEVKYISIALFSRFRIQKLGIFM